MTKSRVRHFCQHHFAARPSLNVLPYFAKNDTVLAQQLKLSREEILQFQNKDLNKLLSLDARAFWAHVCFDDSVRNFLDSFFMFAQRPYDAEHMKASTAQSRPADLLDHLLYRRVLMLFRRMVFDSFTKELVPLSATENVTFASLLGEILYEFEILDVPKMLDLCSIVGPSQLVKELICRVFSLYPLFFKEMRDASQVIAQGLNKAAIQVIQNKTKVVDLESNLDLLKYVYDVTFCLSSFVEAFPWSAIAIHQGSSSMVNGSVLEYVIVFYEVIIPKLLQDAETYSAKDAAELITYFGQQTKVNSLKLIHFILQYGYLNRITAEKDAAKGYLDAMLAQFEDKASVRSDIAELENIIITACPNLANLSDDELENEFFKTVQSFSSVTINVMESVTESAKIKHKEVLTTKQFEKNAGLALLDYVRIYRLEKTLKEWHGSGTKKQTNRTKNSIHIFLDTLENMKVTFGLAAPKFTQEAQEKIFKVMEVFPELGQGFIQACLEYFNDNVETTIQRLADESSLPPVLADMDRNMTNFSSVTAELITPTTSSSIDLQDWQEGTIWLGKKKHKPETIDPELQKQYFQRYMYSDEYDDTYDAVIDNHANDYSADAEERDFVKSNKKKNVTAEQQQQQPQQHPNQKQQPHKNKQPRRNDNKQQQPNKQQATQQQSHTANQEPEASEPSEDAATAQRGRGRGRGYSRGGRGRGQTEGKRARKSANKKQMLNLHKE